MAMQLPFSPSLRPMRKCRAGKQNFNQVLPWANDLMSSRTSSCRAVDIVHFHFFAFSYKNLKNGICVPIQSFVTELYHEIKDESWRHFF